MAASAPGGGAAAGLVPSPTSRMVEVNVLDARLAGMKKTVLNSARAIRDSIEVKSGRYRMAMVTLTYAEVGAWRPGHLAQFFHRVRSYFHERGVKARYVFVAELQERGAVHYHVLFFMPKGLTLPKPDKRGWWPHGSTRTEWAQYALGYLCKYTAKLQSKTATFPRGLRICGAGGVDAAGRRECRWWKLPSYVRDAFDACVNPVRAAGGGFVALATGEWIAARYRFAGVRGGVVRLVDLWVS